jgi:hypothetical protein
VKFSRNGADKEMEDGKSGKFSRKGYDKELGETR